MKGYIKDVQLDIIPIIFMKLAAIELSSVLENVGKQILWFLKFKSDIWL